MLTLIPINLKTVTIFLNSTDNKRKIELRFAIIIKIQLSHIFTITSFNHLFNFSISHKQAAAHVAACDEEQRSLLDVC